jgi:divinyl chlorophyllide a 8-vinyl-reductase
MMMMTSKQFQRSNALSAAAGVLLLAACIANVVAFAPAQSNVISKLSHRPENVIRAFTRMMASPSTAVSASTKPYFADYTFSDKDDISYLIGSGKTAIVAGATGYIGRAVVRECVSRGYNTISLVRDATKASLDEALSGSSLVECDVQNVKEVQRLFSEIASGKHACATYAGSDAHSAPLPIDIVCSCLASASGIESEVYAIDYQAALNLLDAGREPSVSARHFVLLSAFCCRNPLLKLQQAKLKFEDRLHEQNDMTYSIVRPTAFFKSVSGQYESIMDGNSYVLFGDGAVTYCNPIAETDLATYMCDSAIDEKQWGRILNVGGPDEPLSNKMLAEMMFRAIDKPAKFVYVPTEIFDWSIGMIEWIARNFPSQKWEDVLETAKIGKYYAVEDMLTTEEEEKFGSIKMMDHFEKIARDGQDPFTPVRATAVISKTMEALPAISVGIPVGFGLLSKPGLVENVVASSPLSDVPLLIAGLSDNIFS